MSEDHDIQAADREVEGILKMSDEEILREKEAEDAGWVVADNSNNTVVGSGETAFDALSRAHKRLEESV